MIFLSFISWIGMKRKLMIPLFVSFLFIVDQISKYYFYDLAYGSECSFLQPVFTTWISWGMTIPMWLIITFSLVCIVLFIFLYRKQFLTVREFIFFMAWTLWNFFDRMMLWGVRDFIVIGSFPVFNVADMLLSWVLVLFFLRSFFPFFGVWTKKW